MAQQVKGFAMMEHGWIRRSALWMTAGSWLLCGCTESIEGPNRAPVARAGQDQVVRVDENAVLDGSASFDSDGDELSYTWTLIHRPPDGQAGLLAAEGVQTALAPDAPGVWVVSLVVGDGRLDSARDVVQVRAVQACQTDADCGDDGLWCNGVHRCEDGACVFEETDCGDDDICTQDLCDEDADRCEHPPVEEPPGLEGPEGHASCTDGEDNDCDTLTDGEDPDCLACRNDGECDDGNECTSDRCESGECDNQPLADGTYCGDSPWCEGEYLCRNVACAFEERDCSDGDPCTQDVCNEDDDRCEHPWVSEAPGPENLAAGDTCTDGLDNDCDTLIDIDDPECRPCQDNAECNDDNDCTTDTCEIDGCANTQVADQTGCDDERYCTVGDACVGGFCTGSARSCSAQDTDCRLGVCNDDTDACEWDPRPAGRPCDDLLFCTTNDACDGAGGCAGEDISPCIVECLTMCDEGTNSCGFSDPGTACAGYACVDGQTCDGAGNCTGGTSNDANCGAGELCRPECFGGPDGCGAPPAWMTLACTPNPINLATRSDTVCQLQLDGLDGQVGCLTCEVTGPVAGQVQVGGISDDGNGAYGFGVQNVAAQPMTANVLCSWDSPPAGQEVEAAETLQFLHWWDENWSRRRRLVFNNGTQDEDLLAFPVLVVLSEPLGRIDYGQTRDWGQDIRFLDQDDQTLLAHQIESWDEAGNSFVWVHVPQIDRSSNQDFIWMYYGNDSIGDAQNPAGVWNANYMGVWHLDEDVTDEASGAIHPDSTTNANQGYQNGNQDFPGQIATAQDFDGNDHIRVPDSGSLDITGPITVEAWVTFDSLPAADYQHIGAKYDIGNNRRSYDLYVRGDQPRFVISDDGDNRQAVWSGTDIVTGNWYYLVGTWNGTSGQNALKIYINGVETASDWGMISSLYSSDRDVTIGCILENNAPTDILDGRIDELRIMNRYSSPDWIAAQFLSMNDQFIDYRIEEIW